MVVVTARVHDADILPLILARHGRRVRQTRFFRHRQRVHVGAQRHHFAGLSAAGPVAVQDSDHASVRDTGRHFDVERLEVRRHQRRGANLVIGELWVFVNVSMPGDDVGFDRGRFLVDVFVEIRSSGKREQGEEERTTDGNGFHGHRA